jgi:hypothetical protein
VRLHHLTQAAHLTPAAHDEAVRHLCNELNTTETLFPGTDLRLVYQGLIINSPRSGVLSLRYQEYEDGKYWVGPRMQSPMPHNQGIPAPPSVSPRWGASHCEAQFRVRWTSGSPGENDPSRVGSGFYAKANAVHYANGHPDLQGTNHTPTTMQRHGWARKNFIPKRNSLTLKKGRKGAWRGKQEGRPSHAEKLSVRALRVSSNRV